MFHDAGRLDDGDEEESTAPERVRLRRTRAKKGEAGVLDAVFAEGHFTSVAPVTLFVFALVPLQTQDQTPLVWLSVDLL